MKKSIAIEHKRSSQLIPGTGFPDKEISDRRYLVRFARNAAEVDAVLKLRFKVFNLELGEGLDSSFETWRDQDKFDARCHHLVVIERETEKIIGTYRMQTWEMASTAIGFYSAEEFDLSHMPPAVLQNSVELGRACIAKEHRNSRALFSLWRGLAMYMVHTRQRYLFGCCSLTSQDPVAGKIVMDYLEKNGHVHPAIKIPPRPGFECYSDDFNVTSNEPVVLPQLFRIYLNYHAKVCSQPAIDRLFKTIDYLVLLDLNDIDQRTYNMFFK